MCSGCPKYVWWSVPRISLAASRPIALSSAASEGCDCAHSARFASICSQMPCLSAKIHLLSKAAGLVRLSQVTLLNLRVTQRLHAFAVQLAIDVFAQQDRDEPRHN